MDINKFISSIGYDGNSAIVDKVRFSKNKNKDLKTLLQEGSFRSAAAYAVYTNSQDDLQHVADCYNSRSGSHYTKEQIPRLFGVSNVDIKKILIL